MAKALYTIDEYVAKNEKKRYLLAVFAVYNDVHAFKKKN